MQLPYDMVYQVCSGKVDLDPDPDFLGHFLDLLVFFLKIFFSETGCKNFFKFGLQLPHDHVYQVCSGEIDPDPNLALLDHISCTLFTMLGIGKIFKCV